MEIIRAENISHSFGTLQVLHNVNLQVHCGDFIALQGPSGSGKSTLFYILGCLLKPTQGNLWIDGRQLDKFSNEERAWVRNQKVGFVFQQFHLLPRTSVLENIRIPSSYQLTEPKVSSKQAQALADWVGLTSRLNFLPNQLSGGEQQRVAICRALMNGGDILLADEPTGNLDTQSSKKILDLFQELNELGKTIVLITHDTEIADRCNRVYRMRDGRLSEGNKKTFPKRAPHTSHTSFNLVTRSRFQNQNFWNLIRSALPISFDNIRRNKVRSLLNMVGVTIGIASVMAMVTFGDFVKRKILKGYEDLGVNRVSIHGWQNWNLKATDKVDLYFKSFNWEKDVMDQAPESGAASPAYEKVKPYLDDIRKSRDFLPFMMLGEMPFTTPVAPLTIMSVPLVWAQSF